MPPSNQQRDLFEALKKVMKQQGLKYRDLAEHLGLSLAAVKRFMADENMELKRLLSICDWLQIGLEDLVALARIDADSLVHFTEEQERYFAEHIGHFSYFEELNRGLSPVDIAAKHGLSKTSTRLYLRDLEQIGLLERLPAGRIRLLKKGKSIYWDDHGPMGRVYSRYYIATMAERALASTEGGSLSIWSGGRSLTLAHYEQMQADLDDLVSKYRTLSAGYAGSRSDQPYIQFLFIADKWRDNFFDEIPNLG